MAVGLSADTEEGCRDAESAQKRSHSRCPRRVRTVIERQCYVTLAWGSGMKRRSEQFRFRMSDRAIEPIGGASDQACNDCFTMPIRHHKLFTAITAFNPPNANEFEIAQRMRRERASLGV